MMANPSHGVLQALLIAALGRKIKKVIRPDQNVEPARVSRVSVINLTVCILEEDAGARALIAWKLSNRVVVIRLAAGFFLLGLRHVVVEIEIGAERRHPMKTPAHSLLVGRDLWVRCA